MVKSKQNKPSKKPTTKNKDLKTKAESILRRIITSKNIHAPDNSKLKNEIIKDVKGILGKDIQKQIRGLTDPCILLIGEEYRAILSACYIHCDRNIDHRSKISNYRQEIEKREKSRIWHEEAAQIPSQNDWAVFTDIASIDYFSQAWQYYVEKTIGKEDDITVPAKLIDPAVKEYTSSLTQFENVDCFRIDSTKNDIEDWLKWFNSGHTVFLEKLELKDSKECRQFTRGLKAARINKPDQAHGLMIVSADNISNFPEYFVKQFDVIILIFRKLTIN